MFCVSMLAGADAMHKVRIWDLPTRLFHWALALCVLALVVTGQIGGQAMVWHFRFGQAVLSLLVFRLLWGLVGGRWSRWTRLTLGPRAVGAYLRQSHDPRWHAGHNPLGSWAVVVMLLCLLVQATTGLFSDDEIAFAGPLVSLVSGAAVSAATAWHKGWGKILLIVLVLSHLLALLVHRWRRHPPLVPAMVHGDKVLPETVPASDDRLQDRLLALGLLMVSAGTVQWALAWGKP
jgi:cytochrome b